MRESIFLYLARSFTADFISTILQQYLMKDKFKYLPPPLTATLIPLSPQLHVGGFPFLFTPPLADFVFTF